MAELAKVTGVPVATVKYYAREGLLHPGHATAVNQAEYDETHVRRVKLVQALLHLGRLSIADAREVIAAVEDDTVSLHDAFGVAQDAMVPDRDRGGPAYEAALADVDRFVRRHRLRVREGAAVRLMLADALVALVACGLAPDVKDLTSLFDESVASAVASATAEVATVPVTGRRTEQMEHTVVGTVTLDVAHSAIRRMALEHASAKRFGRRQ